MAAYMALITEALTQAGAQEASGRHPGRDQAPATQELVAASSSPPGEALHDAWQERLCVVRQWQHVGRQELAHHAPENLRRG